jgi:methionyl aminopeptidase
MGALGIGRRPVPAGVLRPDYAESGDPGPGPDRIPILDQEQIGRLRAACDVASRVLAVTVRAVRAGITTRALDAIAHDEYLRLGAYPSTLNYRGYPFSICTSVNQEICHGMPRERVLDPGDIVKVDVTAYYQGMHGDCCMTVGVAPLDSAGLRLVAAARKAMERGIAAVRPGRRIREIGRAIEPFTARQGFSVVKEFVGHGIGERFHGEPQVPHHVLPPSPSDPVMQPGMAFTIEPMINEGDWRARVLDDGWTAVTVDGARSAQFEHTVLVTPGGVEVLTRHPFTG